MTTEERVAAVEAWGRFTPRQAAFLTTVMLHGGVCVQRQYQTFARIVNGAKTHDFFRALLARALATGYACRRARAVIYHVHHRRLYELIGEPHSRFRKRANVLRAVERLMVLDAVLMTPRQRWLATEREKVEYFIKRHGVGLTDLPGVTFGSGGSETTRYFVDKLPIGVAALDEVTLVYLITDPTARAFRSFLEAHRGLLKRLRRWRVLFVSSRALQGSCPAHRQVMEDFCAPPLPLAISEEFRWYCRTRRAAEEGASVPAPEAESERYARARRAFGAPRFFAAYRRWCREGDSSLLALASPTFHDAWHRDGGVVETLVLSHAYGHLTPLARSA